MMWRRRKDNRSQSVEASDALDEQLSERQRELDEIKSRTPAVEAVGAKAKAIVEANGFTRAIAASMERR